MIAHEAPRTPARRNHAQGAPTGFSTRRRRGRILVAMDDPKSGLWLDVGRDTVADLFGRAGLMAFDDALPGTA